MLSAQSCANRSTAFLPPLPIRAFSMLRIPSRLQAGILGKQAGAFRLNPYLIFNPDKQSYQERFPLRGAGG